MKNFSRTSGIMFKEALKLFFLFIAVILFSTSFLFTSCNNESSVKESETKPDSINQPVRPVSVKEEPVSYPVKDATLHGFIAYDENKTGKLPIVLVVPEWWGLNEFPRLKARQLAELGYLALSVDIYGEGKVTDNPEEASKLATYFYQNLPVAKERLDAALIKAKSNPLADTTKTALVGYCFGGYMGINSAMLGSNFDGVVSLHGDLEGIQFRKKIKTKFLICHGGEDSFVPQAHVDAFKKSMDSIKADYSFKVYPGATHAFTNPESDEVGRKFNLPVRYNAAADSSSWNDMRNFLSQLFGGE